MEIWSDKNAQSMTYSTNHRKSLILACLDGLKEHWKKELERLVVEDLPEPDKVFGDVKNILEFLPEK